MTRSWLTRHAPTSVRGLWRLYLAEDVAPRAPLAPGVYIDDVLLAAGPVKHVHDLGVELGTVVSILGPDARAVDRRSAIAEALRATRARLAKLRAVGAP